MRKPHPATGFIPIDDPVPGAIDFDEGVKGDYAVEQALIGDLQPLAERLRSVRELLPNERALAADFLDGTRKVKRPSHRPTNPKTGVEHMLLANAVRCLMLLGDIEKAAVAKVSEAEKVKLRTVQEAVSKNPDMFANIKRRARKSRVT